jgi:hypothetical protein
MYGESIHTSHTSPGNIDPPVNFQVETYFAFWASQP